MVRMLDFGLSSPGSPGQVIVLCSFGKALYSRSASHHPGPGCSKPD